MIIWKMKGVLKISPQPYSQCNSGYPSIKQESEIETLSNVSQGYPGNNLQGYPGVWNPY